MMTEVCIPTSGVKSTRVRIDGSGFATVNHEMVYDSYPWADLTHWQGYVAGVVFS